MWICIVENLPYRLDMMLDRRTQDTNLGDRSICRPCGGTLIAGYGSSSFSDCGRSAVTQSLGLGRTTVTCKPCPPQMTALKILRYTLRSASPLRIEKLPVDRWHHSDSRYKDMCRYLSEESLRRRNGKLLKAKEACNMGRDEFLMKSPYRKHNSEAVAPCKRLDEELEAGSARKIASGRHGSTPRESELGASKIPNMILRLIPGPPNRTDDYKPPSAPSTEYETNSIPQMPLLCPCG